MTTLLRYGKEASLTLEIPSEALIAQCDAPRGTPADDLAGAVRAALEAPHGFPSFRQCFVAGDRVALALDPRTPRGATLVAATTEELIKGGIEPTDISVLRAAADYDDGEADPRSELPEKIASAVHLATHDAANRRDLCYLAASAGNKPIYVNRLIHEADFVIPIGMLRGTAARDYHGVAGTIFPTFSDAATQARFHSPAALRSPAQTRLLSAEADEASWLLGSLFYVQVVPGGADSVLAVLAGEGKGLGRQGEKKFDRAWNFTVPGRASLVVAAIEGGPVRQSWFNLARALATASDVVAAGGAVVVCSELATPPSAPLRSIIESGDRSAAMRALAKERPLDALIATRILQSLEKSSVYLLSRLAPAAVEELGIVPVDSAAELTRLVSRHGSCVALANADSIVVALAEEA